MGYQMRQIDASFRIKEENVEAAYQAVLSLPNAPYQAVLSLPNATLEEAMHNWGWAVVYAGTMGRGDIEDIYFCGDKMGEEDLVFGVIAPYVCPGSYIEMYGEDGERWRWVFDGKQVSTVYPKIDWE